ncbi:MAG: hypothetical protein ACRYFS_18475 [Janthinobacterium lividum]
MVSVQEQYLTDREGKRVGVVLDLEQFQRILEDLEELEDIRAYDIAKASGNEAILFDQAVAEIEQRRK